MELFNNPRRKFRAGNQIMSPERVRPRMSGLRARPREQQETESTRSRLMTMPLISLAHSTRTFLDLQC